MSRASERIGEYRIVGEVTRAATYSTYEAVHVVLPRRALLKVMSTTTQRFAVRVLREAYILDALQHPGVPRIFESALLPDGRAWFARELVDGPTLERHAAATPLDRLEVIGILRDIAAVLAHAHHHGVVHGGLRPDRVVLADRAPGFPLCIADWSDARAHDAAPIAYVPSPGTWHYTAPEVVNGDAVDDRADVFALGVIAYEILTGTLPFDRGALAMREAAGHHVPTEVRCADAPRELTGLVDQMLSYDRFDRPSAAEVQADLGWLVDALQTSMMRIRKPRWTPPLTFAAPEDYDKLEIDLPYDESE